MYYLKHKNGINRSKLVDRNIINSSKLIENMATLKRFFDQFVSIIYTCIKKYRASPLTDKKKSSSVRKQKKIIRQTENLPTPPSKIKWSVP
jgi:hypothetical protein